jgi:parallel beta-helix repeat protein
MAPTDGAACGKRSRRIIPGGRPAAGRLRTTRGIVKEATVARTGNGTCLRRYNKQKSQGVLARGSGSVISGNTANNNTEYGIYCNGSGCLISGNTLFSNNLGIGGDQTSGFGGNVLKNTTNFLGTTSLGAGNTNLCTTGVISSAC